MRFPRPPRFPMTTRGYATQYNPTAMGPDYLALSGRQRAPSPMMPAPTPMPSLTAALSGVGGIGEPPALTNIHVDSSIPLSSLIDVSGHSGRYLPHRFVQQRLNTERAELEPDYQMAVENMAATQNDLASASSGYKVGLLPGMFRDQIQQQGLAELHPLRAAMQRYGLETTGLAAQADEVHGLGRAALSSYEAQLRDYQNELALRAALIRALGGGL
jgi:hypothetical protein